MNPLIPHYKVMVTRALIVSEIHYNSLSAVFIPLAAQNTNQELFEKYVYNQSSHYEKYGWCCVPQLSSESSLVQSEPCIMVGKFLGVW